VAQLHTGQALALLICDYPTIGAVLASGANANSSSQKYEGKTRYLVFYQIHQCFARIFAEAIRFLAFGTVRETSSSRLVQRAGKGCPLVTRNTCGAKETG
jgi:hypothetical protein